MHLDAILEALPTFAAGGNSNYLNFSYLYPQKMKYLEKQNPKVNHEFMNEFHVIRRTSQYWAGLGSDLVIEQTLMRSLKSTGGHPWKWHDRTSKSLLDNVCSDISSIQLYNAGFYRHCVCKKWAAQRGNAVTNGERQDWHGKTGNQAWKTFSLLRRKGLAEHYYGDKRWYGCKCARPI